MPVYVKAEKPFDYSNPEHRQDVIDSVHLDENDIENLEEGQWTLIESRPVQRVIKANGFDGYYIEEGGAKNLAVYNPTQIKSAIGNNGQFDPTNPDIRYSRETMAGRTDRQYTPDQIDAFRNTGRLVKEVPLRDRLRAVMKDAGRKMAQGIFDQFAPMAEIDKEAYALMRLSKGSSGAFEALLHGGKLKLTDNVYDINPDARGGFVEEVLVPLQGEHHDFLWWVAGNRAERLAKEGRENLFSESDIAAFKSLADGELKNEYTLRNGPNAGQTTRNRLEAYEDSLKSFDAFNRNVMDLAEQSGLIDPESRKFWEHEFYVPFYRVSDDESGGFNGARVKKGLVRQQAFKELKGGKDKLNSDLLDNTLLNWAHLLDSSAKNRAAVAALEAAADMGVAIEAKETAAKEMAKAMGKKSNVVWAMTEGQQRWFVVEDNAVLQALLGLEFAGFRNPIMDALSAPKHWLTVGVTASPYFKIRNLIRDSIQAISVSNLSYNPYTNLREGGGGELLKDSVKGVANVLTLNTINYGLQRFGVNALRLSDNDSEEHFRLLAGGGTIHFGSMLEGSEAKRVQKLVEMGVKDFTILDDPLKYKAFWNKFIQPAVTAYNEIGNRGEEVNRASLYAQLRKQGMSHAEASLQARDLMDFSLQGTWNTIRFLSQVVPFFNARLQGMYKLGRGAAENPKRFMAVTGMVALASIALLAAYHDDDDWKQREEWDRNNFWWFKFGGLAFRIPKPFEVGAIGTLAERGFEWMFDKEMTNKRFIAQVRKIIGDNLSLVTDPQSLIPQAIKPIVDLYANKDSFTGRDIESQSMERVDPQYRYNSGTSMFARGASSAMSSVVGNAALSPVQIDHMLRGYFGWLGSFIVGAADTVARPATGQPEKPTPDYWKVATGNIVSDKDSGQSRYVTQMYEQAKELEQAYATHRMLLKHGKQEEAKEYAKDNADKLRLYGRVEGVRKNVAAINEQIRIIERSSKSADEKREKIDALKARQDKLARSLVR